MNKVYLMDCMEGMRGTPDKYYDLAVVDPPYGINFGEYKRTKKDALGLRHKSKSWDNATPNAEYFDEIKRVSKNYIVFGGNYFIELAKIETPNLKTIEQFNDYILNSRENWIFWYKQNPVPNFADGELAWSSFGHNDQIDYRYYGNLEGKTSTTEKIHPTQKPVGLYDILLQKYATKGMKILDTHAGSMSSVISAMKNEMQITAYEIDSDYFNAGKKRIETYLQQGDMFNQPKIEFIS